MKDAFLLEYLVFKHIIVLSTYVLMGLIHEMRNFRHTASPRPVRPQALARPSTTVSDGHTQLPKSTRTITSSQGKTVVVHVYMPVLTCTSDQ
jgi:hypothetical protein